MNQKNSDTNPTYAIVSEDEAKKSPYPYLYVNDDGTARELHRSERSYLETSFNPFDGNRPFVKDTYEQKNGWGNLHGFCHRSKIPVSVKISPAPLDDPYKPSNKTVLEEQIEFYTKQGWDVIQNPDGTVTFERKKK